MADIKDEIGIALSDQSYVRSVNMDNIMLAAERKAVRQMLECYFENSSEFAIDLVGAVIHQGSFILKIHDIDWLHSPTANLTMSRLLCKYDRFLDLAANRPPGKIAVPTLDVDLAWHTHMLSPLSYYLTTTQKLHLFLDHEDKVDETLLHDGFEWTSKAYQRKYGEIYSECICWYCEVVREPFTAKQGLRKSIKQKIGGKSNGIQSQLESLYASNEVKQPHISAHNATKSTTPGDREPRTIRERNVKLRLEIGHRERAERAYGEGHAPPPRSEYQEYLHYAVPIFAPTPMPYECDNCITPSLYAASPASATFMTGSITSTSL